MQFEQGVAVSNVATRHAEGFVRSIRKHGFLDEADIVIYSEGYLGMYKHLKTAIKMLKAGKIKPARSTSVTLCRSLTTYQNRRIWMRSRS